MLVLNFIKNNKINEMIFKFSSSLSKWLEIGKVS